jgi:hypothetical protein
MADGLAFLRRRQVFWLWIAVVYAAIVYAALRWGSGPSIPAPDQSVFPGSD